MTVCKQLTMIHKSTLIVLIIDNLYLLRNNNSHIVDIIVCVKLVIPPFLLLFLQMCRS